MGITSNLYYTKVFKYIFVVCAIAAIAYSIDIENFFSLLKQVSIPFFLFMLVVAVIDLIFMGIKWNILLHLYNIWVPVWVPILAYLRGRVFNYIAPSSLGMDAYKIYCVKKYHTKIAPIFSSIFIERSFGILSSISIVLLLLPLSVDFFDISNKEYIILFSLLGFFCLCLIIHAIQSNAELVLRIRFPSMFPEKVHYYFDLFVKNISLIKYGRNRVWAYFSLSIMEKASYGLVVYLSSRALGLSEPGFLLILSIAPIVALLERLPITFSGIGIREGLFVFLFSPFYSDPTIPLAISLIMRAADGILISILLLTWHVGRNSKDIETELRKVRDSNDLK